MAYNTLTLFDDFPGFRSIMSPRKDLAFEGDWLTKWGLANMCDINVARHPVHLIERTKETLHVEFDVPGCSKEDLQVSYLDEILTVSCLKEDKGRVEKMEYRIRADGYDVETFDAKCDKGVLTIKAKGIAEPQKCNITVK